MATSTALAFNPFISFGVGISGGSPEVKDIKIDSNKKILLAGGFIRYTGTVVNYIVRLNSDGSRDTTFTTGTGFGGGSTNSLAILNDQKILVAGGFTSYSGITVNDIVRLNTNGTLDTTFDVGTGFDSIGVYSIAVQSDGKIVAGGLYTTFTGTSQNYIVRLNSDGSKDTSFVIGTGFNSTVNNVKIQSDGKILCGGSFFLYSGAGATRITRLNTDGTRDTTFSNAPNSSVNTMVIQSDGKILVGGSFSTMGGSSYNKLARLNTNGSTDGTFNIGTGFNGAAGVKSIKIDQNGKIYVGGDFTTFQGSPQKGLIRLNSNGSKDASFDIGTGFQYGGADGAIINTIETDVFTLAGGYFTTYNQLTISGITAIGQNGTIATGQTNISGTQQIGNLAIATASTVNYSFVPFWMGPDQDLGYVIGIPVPAGNQSTPISGVRAFLGFNRSSALTESAFVNMVNQTFNQSFTGGTQSKTYLNNNGYWTSY